MWGIEVELDELRETMARLCEQDTLRKVGARYQLTDAGRAEIDGRKAEHARIEAEAFAEWETAVRAVAPSIEQGQLAVLRDDLVSWLQQIVVRHGVEAAMVLYPEDDRGRPRRITGCISERGYGQTG